MMNISGNFMETMILCVYCKTVYMRLLLAISLLFIATYSALAQKAKAKSNKESTNQSSTRAINEIDPNWQGPPALIIYSTPSFQIKEHYHDSVIGYKFYGKDDRILAQSFFSNETSYTFSTGFQDVYRFVGDMYKDQNFIRHQFSFERAGTGQWVEQDLVSGKKTIWQEEQANIVKSDTVIIVDPESGKELLRIFKHCKVVARN